MVNIRTSASNFFQRLSVILAVSALVCLPLAAPIEAFADPATCTAPSDSTYGAGVHHPVGADASLYTYDCTSNLWVNAHFSYNPVNGQYTALDPVVYTYNPSTGKYDYNTWVYSAPSRNYVKVTSSVATPPTGATVVGAPAPAVATPTPAANSISNTGDGSNNTINDNGGVTDGSSINNTGPGSNNTIGGNANNTTTGNNNTGVSVTNGLDANATTGNSLVLGNTTAGSAASGDATDTANVMNLLQSSSNALGGNAVTFVANIDGDVNGNLLLDPSTLGDIQPAGNTDGNNTTNLTNTSNESITNNLDLSADSGNANVSDNTSAGDATSGAAKTIANVVNVIDSAITAGKSFLGVININGNLNGNILMPADFVNQLLAANVPTVNIVTNTGPSSNNTINDNSGSNNTNVSNTNNQGITNNVNATANTGNAKVSDNTGAGSATSGSANTGITAFNLTGSQVIGQNDLLVFVNVVGGSWVGLIVNAPAGTTAAEFGGGISAAGGNANNNTNVTNNTNQTITNNINEDSQSGNASVDRNTQAGNAKSGNADDAVNLLNVQNSTLTLSNWFGILFINVFGTWNGNFGFQTPATAGGNSSGTPGSFVASPAFSFQPTNTKSSASGSGNIYAQFTPKTSSGAIIGGSGGGSGSTANSILSAAKNVSQTPHSVVSTPSHVNWLTIVTGCGILALYLSGERFYAVRQRSRTNV